MIRTLSLLVVAAMAITLLGLQAPADPIPSDDPARALPTFTICPVIEGGGRSTDIAAASTGEGSVRLTLFANGDTAGSITVSTGEGGATVIPVVDVAAVGTVGGMVELPSPSSAAASVIRGASSVSIESCAVSSEQQVFITGGVTSGQRGLSLHLMNPFAGDAVVTLTVYSEVGLETNSRFETVIVPSRGSNVLEMAEIIPGRERISVVMDVSSGRVIATARQTDGGDSSIWNAVPPGTDWFLPIPSVLEGRVLIGNPGPTEVEYQVDVYGPGGVEAADVSGVLAAGEEGVVELSDHPGVRAFRVVATAPVVAALQARSEGLLGVTTGAQVATGTWLLPAAFSGGSVRIVLMNPGLEDASASVRSMRPGSRPVPVSIPAEGVVELSLDGAAGYLVDADLPVVAVLAAFGPGTGGLSIGVPVEDG